jgi:hypothetical protein
MVSLWQGATVSLLLHVSRRSYPDESLAAYERTGVSLGSLAAPASKPALSRPCLLCGTETHADAAKPRPDSLHAASHTREDILEVKGIWQPDLPAQAQLCSTLRRIFDATGEIASVRHQNFCGPVN